MEYRIEEIPEWIKYDSKLFDNMVENKNNSIVVPNNLIVSYPHVRNIREFKNILECKYFWIMRNYQLTLYDFGYENKEIVTEYLSQFINST